MREGEFKHLCRKANGMYSKWESGSGDGEVIGGQKCVIGRESFHLNEYKDGHKEMDSINIDTEESVSDTPEATFRERVSDSLS